MTDERITRVTLEEARKMKGQTDWTRLDAMTEEEIERNAAEDLDNPPWTDEDWASAQLGRSAKTRRGVADRDIVDWFREQGPHFQGAHQRSAARVHRRPQAMRRRNPRQGSAGSIVLNA